MTVTESEKAGIYDPLTATMRYTMQAPALAQQYSHERLVGRRVKSYKPPARITKKHLIMIAMHLQGFSGVAVANKLTEAWGTEISASQVYSVLAHPVAVRIIGDFNKGLEQDLLGLKSKVVDTVRGALEDESIKTQLQGVDRWGKLTGAFDKDDEDTRTGEDVIAAALEAVNKSLDLVEDTRPDRAKVITLEKDAVSG